MFVILTYNETQKKIYHTPPQHQKNKTQKTPQKSLKKLLNNQKCPPPPFIKETTSATHTIKEKNSNNPKTNKKRETKQKKTKQELLKQQLKPLKLITIKHKTTNIQKTMKTHCKILNNTKMKGR